MKSRLIPVLLLVLFAVAALIPWKTGRTEVLPKRNAASMGAIKCTVAKFLLGDIDSTRQIAPLFENLGNHSLPIRTGSGQAQAFFNQGLRLTYAFNHAEGHRSFLEAARLDPEAAMAYWGQAYDLGPNINDPEPDEDRKKKALEALEMANRYAGNASELEQGLIRALNARYSPDTTLQTAHLNTAYMDAMKGLADRYPDHAEVLTLYAAAIMNTMPWAYWEASGEPAPNTLAAKAALEKAIALDPKHPGAHHYYIHLMELPDPDRAVSSAESLENLMPGAGHIVHMPSHIYIRVGRYKDAVRVNQLAIEADEDYISQCYSQGLYPLAYYPHNVHFLWSAASLIGESETALSAARKTAEKVPVGEMKELPFLQDFAATPLLAYLRFGKWNHILTFPAPNPEIKHLNLMRHYARGIAFLRKGNIPEAREELQAIDQLVADPDLASIVATANNASDRIAAVARAVVAGEIAAATGDFESAVRFLEEAVALEDNLTYTEPSAWHIPPRQNLGAVLMAAGDYAAAEAVYREDLLKLRQNGWSLLGLSQSLEAQGRSAEAEKVREEFRETWQHADLEIPGSVF
ncbi:M48 family metallopeptidase [Robiginitalea sp. SC105]|uniref:tetratricopeptide repeat protein n=1 Tax=Robiginitalea sp. SC105 TaxID=2762332 RepID=UPI001639C5EA|nr:tetratricopeptide repeat protein [Robiginitalea sp. SC105]MBC2840170.1 tetratricopeptide repeat protein [Robiginitalea sp. SC105]